MSKTLNTEELLRYLILEKFPGNVVLTASLVASSVTVLKMVADIDRKTPIVFCHPRPVFPESVIYRERIVEMLQLETCSTTHGVEVDRKASGTDHYEKMWVNYPSLRGRSFQLHHLNESVRQYDCWISAVYHVDRPPSARQRVDVEGDLIRVDPLLRWSKDDVRAFMKKYKLPYHKRAVRKDMPLDDDNSGSLPSYAY